MKYEPVYPWSMKEAIKLDELEKWRDSYKANCLCARMIEKGIEENYADGKLDTDFMKDIISEFSYDRVNFVLANSVQEKMHDGRISKDNKEWAKKTYIPSDDVRWHYTVEAHSGLTDLCVSRYRDEWDSLKLYDKSHCTDESYYEDKLLVFKPSVLADEYKTADFQLFYATSGFGCDPTKMGTSISGYFLKDDEFCSFRRADFFGVIDEQYLPQWAVEKLQEIRTQDEGIQMEGEMKCE